MTLRRRIFLLVSAIVVLMLVGETLLVRSLAGQLDRDVASVVVRVGEDILQEFEFRPGMTIDLEGEAEHFQARVEERVGELSEPRPDQPGDGQPEPLPVPGAEGAHGVFYQRQLWVTQSRPDPPTAAPPVVVEGETPPQGHRLRVIERRETSNEVSLEPHEQGRVILLRGPQFERQLRVPSAPVASTVDRFESQLLLGSLALLALGLAATAIVVHRATRPLEELRSAAERIGAGEWGISVPVARDDEVGAAITAFNVMSKRLVDLDRENRRLADSEQLSELAEVARGLAHTLRNPLNALGLAVERLAGETEPGRAEELAERCRRQIRRIDGSLRSFLALASAPAAEPEAVELGTLAREVALEALQDASSRVRIEVDAPAPVVLGGVAAELKAILQALVVNACEASPDDGVVTVRVRSTEQEEGRVEIEDEGAGVAPEVAARLFAPHVTTKPHGSGMGLYLARRLATTRYGGDVELAPRQAAGATVGTRATVTLAGRSEVAR